MRRSVRCTKLKGKHFSWPQQSDLPKECAADDPPYTHTGIDFAGPLYTSGKGANEEDTKAYVCLFTAVHAPRQELFI